MINTDRPGLLVKAGVEPELHNVADHLRREEMGEFRGKRREERVEMGALVFAEAARGGNFLQVIHIRCVNILAGCILGRANLVPGSLPRRHSIGIGDRRAGAEEDWQDAAAGRGAPCGCTSQGRCIMFMMCWVVDAVVDRGAVSEEELDAIIRYSGNL